MLNVFLDPFSKDFLSNKIFGHDPVLNRDDCLEVWRYLKDYCAKHGIELNTVDFWNKGKARTDDIYVALNHNEKPLFREIYYRLTGKQKLTPGLDKFGRRILLQFETPVVQPWPYDNMKALARIYDTLCFSWKTPETAEHGYIHYPQPFSGIMPKYWNNTTRSFMAMINTNKRFFSPPNELHTKRIEAVIYFGKFGEIDLYGRGWDKPVGDSKDWDIVTRSYKGSIESKYDTLSKYRFAICFENMALSGYITEKIIDCLHVGTVPIYWGAQDIEDYIPKGCFIDMRDFKDYAALRTYLKSIDNKKMNEYRENAKQYLDSEQYRQFTKEYFAELFVDLVNGVPRKS